MDGWTPEIVRDRLVDALQWAGRAAGLVGPAGVKSAMPRYIATFEDHMDEGWGIPEVAGDDDPEERQLRVMETPEAVARHLAALQWQADFLADAPGPRAFLALWLKCRVWRGSFESEAKRRGVSRGVAYALRDRGLSLIAIGLTDRGDRP